MSAGGGPLEGKRSNVEERPTFNRGKGRSGQNVEERLGPVKRTEKPQTLSLSAQMSECFPLQCSGKTLFFFVEKRGLQRSKMIGRMGRKNERPGRAGNSKTALIAAKSVVET